MRGKAWQDAATAKPTQAPPTPAVPAVGTTPAPAAAVGRLDVMSYSQLKARLNELQSQRQTLANRRADVARTYENATGISRDGIGARLSVMDKSMVQIETDLAAVGQAMVNKAQPAITVPPPPARPGRGPINGGGIAIGLFVFLATMVVAVPAAVRRAKRRWLQESPNAGTPNVGRDGQRLDRIEQAVDAIAIEIERVSENQRFMTRLMTETQLAGSLAAVRGSTELAKAAAEKGSGG